MKITFGGNPLTLAGTQLQVGDTLENFTALKNDLTPVTLNDFTGLKVISVVPSLDTGVCDFQTKKFNEELSNTTVLTLSVDLPFAQARWCGANGVDHVVTLSDYNGHDFAKKSGTLIQELQLLTRAIIIVDENNKVLYTEYLDEITNHPDYDKAIAFVNSL